MSYEYLDKTGAKYLAGKLKGYSDGISISFGGTTYTQSNQLISLPLPTDSAILGATKDKFAKSISFSSSAKWATSYSAVNNTITLPTSGWAISITGSAGSVAHSLTAGSKKYNGSADVEITKADIGLGSVVNEPQTDIWSAVSSSYFTAKGANALYNELDKKIANIVSNTALAYAISINDTSVEVNVGTIDGKPQIATYPTKNASFNSTESDITITYVNPTDSNGPYLLKLTDGTAENLASLKVGDTVLIKEENVPDRWVSAVTKDPTKTNTYELTLSRLETDNRNIYAHCVSGNQDKVKYAETADNSTKLGGQAASYYATASSVTSVTSTANTNKTDIAGLKTSVANMVPYDGATKDVYLGSNGIYSGTRKSDGSLTPTATDFALKPGYLMVSSAKATGVLGAYSATLEYNQLNVSGTLYRDNRIQAPGTFFYKNADTGEEFTFKSTGGDVVTSGQMSAIPNDTIDTWF